MILGLLLFAPEYGGAVAFLQTRNIIMSIYVEWFLLCLVAKTCLTTGIGQNWEFQLGIKSKPL